MLGWSHLINQESNMKNKFSPILTQVLADSVQVKGPGLLLEEAHPPTIKDMIRSLRLDLLDLFARRVQPLNGINVEEAQHVLEYALPEVVVMLEKLAKTIYALERANSYDYQLNWVDVRDALPEPNADVFYFFEVTGACMGQYRGDGKTNEFGGHRGFLGDDVTIWATPPAIDF